MPLDATGFVVSEPSLAFLSEVLRTGPAHAGWPEGLAWSFRYPDRCAMGVAVKLWPQRIRSPELSEMVQAFGLTESQAEYIFHRGARWFPELVTPEIVALRIDNVLHPSWWDRVRSWPIA